VKTLHEGLDIPVTCKIRVFTDEEKTLDLVKRIEKAGKINLN
jgi:tRNA-dihydrouridine synthase